MVHVSVIGCGNMGSALIRGLSRTGNHTITACDVDEEVLDEVEPYCETTTTDLAEAAEATVVFVVVKPDLTAGIVDDLDLSAEQTLVSIAAGVSTDALEPRTDATVVRVMPNLAAATGDMAAAVAGDEITDEVAELLDDAGVFVEIDEAQMHTSTAVNGSGPAFVFYLIKAMMDAGVESGLNPDEAKVLAAQTFKGAAETVIQSEESIDQLIDDVCSPKGTTIEGMKVLRESTADEAVAEAVFAAERRSEELAGEGDDE
ncbi:pyrroline-5-carboxylate reductase [Natronoarchaeum philippinense]|uniref:Pyrroline-5-carboxylate reductase n=1 Tax=Natronoarchaeum philippinense TaxID=558529 RepID=A0A285NZH9_NATPI|nr:pyrroline-5-carboxylate reductase [Natronoarchaeum philippinense]SNZ14870.1 pyrroline-5-carboxylate reductase [Natronoarchaeum philippinense]